MIVAGAAAAWARDVDSFAVLRELLGNRFDERRHRLGVDVAFLLPAQRPATLPDMFQQWTAEDRPVVGVNVSGLLANPDAGGTARFGLRFDYLAGTVAFIRQVLDRTDARVLLIPHVRGRFAESDEIACDRVADHLDVGSDRLHVVRADLNAMQAKWLIGQCAWFTGGRMHSTIAALSQCVPVAATAYSDKTAGVFATCGARDDVVDARSTDLAGYVDFLWASWQERGLRRADLAQRVPRVIDSAEEQWNDILAAVDPLPASA